jgi:nucleoid DNA-binding protein
MKLREWARATQKHMMNETPAAERSKYLSQADVEEVLRVAIDTMIEALANGDELHVRSLGRFWVEELPPRRVVSNLPDTAPEYHVKPRLKVRFRSSVGVRLSTEKH